MEYRNLKLERDGQVAVVTLNRPETLNAINQDMHLEIMEACRELAADDGVRAVVWTGEGCVTVTSSIAREIPYAPCAYSFFLPSRLIRSLLIIHCCGMLARLLTE